MDNGYKEGNSMKIFYWIRGSSNSFQQENKVSKIKYLKSAFKLSKICHCLKHYENNWNVVLGHN
jgi:hypothetical protein